MSLKSWAFWHNDQWIRLEIYWQGGWSYSVMYLDHQLAAETTDGNGRELRFLNQNEQTKITVLEARFPYKWHFQDRDCQVMINGEEIDFSTHPARIEYPTDPSHLPTPPATWSKLFSGCLVLLLLLPLLAIFGTVYTLARFVVHQLRTRKLHLQLRARSRLSPWEKVSQRATKEGGTWIVHDATNQVSLWWTPDDVIAVCPFPLITTELSQQPFGVTTPGDIWCETFVFDTEKGSGVFSELSKEQQNQWRYPQANGFVQEFERQFSDCKLIFTMRHAQELRPKLIDFLKGSESLDALVEYLYGSDDDLGWMAIHAIRKMEHRDSAKLLPALLSRFQYGPMSQRFEVALTLLEFGEQGIVALLTLSEDIDDPRVSREAKACLEYKNHVLMEQ